MSCQFLCQLTSHVFIILTNRQETSSEWQKEAYMCANISHDILMSHLQTIAIAF